MTRYLVTTSWILIILAALLAVWLVPDVLAASLGIAIQVIIYAVSFAVVVLVLYAAWSGLERIMMLRAQRKATEHDALIKVIEAPHDHTVWTHQVDYGYHSLTMDSRVHVAPGDNRAATADEVRTWATYHQLQVPRTRVVGGDANALAAPEAMPDMRSMIGSIPVAIVVGPMNAGKTTLLHWVLDEYRNRAHVLVLDPHSGPDAWPGARVAGTGRNFGEISEALDGLVRLMNKRYQEIGAGQVREGEHPPIVVVADEWTSINQNCDNADKLMQALLTESRKAALRVYVGSHSRRVKSLGVDRRGDLLDGVAFILLHNDGGQRWAEVEIDGETQRVVLPGEYRVIAPDARDVLATALEPPELEPDDEELQVLMLNVAGRSMKEISESVWGQGKFGSYYNNKIRAVLDKWAGWEPDPSRF